MRGINEQLLKTSGADFLSSRKQFRKTSEEAATTPFPPVRPRVDRICCFCDYYDYLLIIVVMVTVYTNQGVAKGNIVVQYPVPDVQNRGQLAKVLVVTWLLTAAEAKPQNKIITKLRYNVHSVWLKKHAPCEYKT